MSLFPESSSSFDAGPADTVLSVRELAVGMKTLLEDAFDDVWVEGEISNWKQPASGHCYFTLKDEDAQLRCVMWKGFARHVYFQPQDGMLVRLHGSASLYERRGDVQLVARSLQLAGQGALQKAFEALKEKLRAEGLFDYATKQPLPPFPEVVGVVTSGTGAALHDVLSILQRRFPCVRVLVCPVQVQGLGAAEAITEAVEAFNELPPGDPLRPDVLIVGRGGGSVEDLWAFNEEILARALFASEIPIVSAVGHETDYSIADFVADVRAATPSNAAELVAPDRREVEAVVRTLVAYLREGVAGRLQMHRQRVEFLTASYAFNRPLDRLRQHAQQLDDLSRRLHRGAQQALGVQAQKVEALHQRLALLDPRRPLRRGYARVEREGRPVRAAADLAPGDVVALHFDDGRQEARIEERPLDEEPST